MFEVGQKVVYSNYSLLAGRVISEHLATVTEFVGDRVKIEYDDGEGETYWKLVIPEKLRHVDQEN